MSNHLPSVGVVTTSTNSLSRGYPALLACVETWGSWADQIVIVDGGTTDETYSVLKNWTSVENYEICSSPETYWDTHSCFHPAQWTINTLAGLEKLQTDWAVIVPADHILDLNTVNSIRHDLLQYNHCLGGRFIRKRFRGNDNRIEIDHKWYILNLKKIRNDKVFLGWDLDRTVSCLADYPLVVDHHTAFIDPVNGVLKKHYAGLKMPLTFSLPLTCWSYGFYFFSPEQVLNHLRDFHTVFCVRYSQQGPKEDIWHLRHCGLDKICGYLSKEEELRKPHICEVKKLIDHFYHPKMAGSAVRSIRKNHRNKNFTRWVIGKINTLRFGMTEFKSIQNAQTWRPVSEDLSEPLDIKALYKEQDCYLPESMRINWEQLESRRKSICMLKQDI